MKKFSTSYVRLLLTKTTRKPSRLIKRGKSGLESSNDTVEEVKTVGIVYQSPTYSSE